MTEEKPASPGESPAPEQTVASETPALPGSSPPFGGILTGQPISAATLPAAKAPPQHGELNLEKRLKAVYADNLMTSAEFMALRDDADMLFDKLKVQFPDNGALALFQPLSDVAVQAMQLAILDFRKAKPSAEAKALAKQSFGFQVAYIKACLDRFTQAL
ncbi:hypothetical protein [Pseudomonas syringae]|uniref:Uncharacterized protein n=1 Tax=Pseudomonas syringae pv. papulans TaxID=83963 RepID=A0A0P9Y7D5_PSESX|nr:hypothetical protein [Pseudomonas syringae]KPY29059.1 Uncharacterized protein ALO65_02680 [Pseudomonas syringae pv. papulans]KWS33322.1 hypothetical protein AL059_11515 [Pseudomonas syringae pv. papulans]MDH4601931.1 hypothetical protein [Pseudomonas syringae pv. papulans]MDH4623602.1 hypothetical protein [Pseudomonas syringae pv. papulans]RMN37846.1 hypothetical protein ALQ60_04176 [Pseudomonas syringae pv. papulans]